MLQRTLRASLYWSLLLLMWISAQAVPDFSFIHITDTHFPSPAGGSERVLPTLSNLGEIPLTPYKVTAPKPSFILSTGDVTEFGGLFGNALETFFSALGPDALPIYIQSGNHDSTWSPIRPEICQRFGSPYYSFEASGCHFIGLDSAGLLDPRPSFGEEQLRWLREDLKKTGPTTPIFLFFHHPYRIVESASDYDWDRLADEVRPYNVVLLLIGHWHRAAYRHIDGFDEVEAGLTFSAKGDAPEPGYSVISVQDNVLRVAYKRADDTAAAVPLLEKRLPARSTYPAITLDAPAGTVTGTHISINATIANAPDGIKSAIYEIDTNTRDEQGHRGQLTLKDGRWVADAPVAGLRPGAHYCRVTFTDAKGEKYHRSTQFSLERGTAAYGKWRTFLGGSSRSVPAVAHGHVYVGSNDCLLYALDKETGEIVWTYPTKGEITGEPLVLDDGVVFASADGALYAVTPKGKLRWSYATGDPIWSSPVRAGDAAIVCTRTGAMYAVDLKTGQLRWQKPVAKYNIEAKPAVTPQAVYVGAWDGKLYAVRPDDGETLWSADSAGTVKSNAARYYSPADSSPVISGDRIFVADRAYRLTIMDTATGDIISSQTDCAAVGLAGDGKAVYLRKTDGALVKADLNGKPLWSAKVEMDNLPAAPVEKDGIVYACSRLGLVSAVSASDGALLWQYQATPQLYVYSSPAVYDGIVYVTGMDGAVTAIAAR